MIVCEKCLAYLESREGRMAHKYVESMEEILQDTEFPQELIVDEDEEIVCCEWCEEEYPASDLVII